MPATRLAKDRVVRLPLCHSDPSPKRRVSAAAFAAALRCTFRSARRSASRAAYMAFNSAKQWAQNQSFPVLGSPPQAGQTPGTRDSLNWMACSCVNCPSPYMINLPSIRLMRKINLLLLRLTFAYFFSALRFGASMHVSVH